MAELWTQADAGRRRLAAARLGLLLARAHAACLALAHHPDARAADHVRTGLWRIAGGYAANYVLPARLGELVRADFLGRRYGVSRLSVVGTIVVERVFDLIVFVGFIFAGLWALHLRDDSRLAPVLPYDRIGSPPPALSPCGFGCVGSVQAPRTAQTAGVPGKADEVPYRRAASDHRRARGGRPLGCDSRRLDRRQRCDVAALLDRSERHLAYRSYCWLWECPAWQRYSREHPPTSAFCNMHSALPSNCWPCRRPQGSASPAYTRLLRRGLHSGRRRTLCPRDVQAPRPDRVELAAARSGSGGQFIPAMANTIPDIEPEHGNDRRI